MTADRATAGVLTNIIWALDAILALDPVAANTTRLQSVWATLALARAALVEAAPAAEEDA